MWECKYGREALDMRLFVLRLFKKSPLILLAGILGALCVGGPYFLLKVTFGPAKEYEAVTDFYIDYAMQEDGTQHTYINFATWNQLVKDDVFTDRILTYMSELKEGSASLAELEAAAGLTKEELRGHLSATVLSDTRIATTTVRTNDPALTMRIEKALVEAMFDFGKQQKEIAEIRILQKPSEASLVIADVRTFRACMVGAVVFSFAAALYLSLYFTLDEGIHVPPTFERRFGIPMLGTIHSKELPALAGKLLTEGQALLAVDEGTDLGLVKRVLAEKKIGTAEAYHLEELFENRQAATSGKTLLLVIKAGAHNGKRIEKALDFCKKCGMIVTAALLWEADERLIRAYEMPEHVFHAWGKVVGEKEQNSAKRREGHGDSSGFSFRGRERS